MKKILVYVTAAALALTVFGFNPAEAEAAPKSKGIEREGSAKRTVYVGKSFELEVEKGKKLRDNDLYWSVGNSKIVKIVDKDRTDDEIDLKAVKTGKTKVYCKNKVTGNKLSYTITVKKASKGISRVGNTSIVGFDDDDRYDNEMEFIARNAGTTKIYAKNTKTGNSIAYTVNVIPDYDD